MHSVVIKGLVHVVYGVEADMTPEQQQGVLSLLEQELRGGPVAVVFTVKPGLGVDPAVPAFWLDVTKRFAPKLCAIAIASPSVLVRTAGSGFAIANMLRRIDVAVQAFDDERLALTWAGEQLARKG